MTDETKDLTKADDIPDDTPPVDDGQNTPPADNTAPDTQQAPAAYDFRAPDGIELNAEVVGAFAEAAGALGLDARAAQQIVDKVAPALAASQQAQIDTARQRWTQASQSDSEFGGQALDANLAIAKNAYARFASDELKGFLEETGLGNHPEMIRLFYRTGKALSEDSILRGNAANAPSTAQQFYAASHMNP